jgi:hypothetical protein
MYAEQKWAASEEKTRFAKAFPGLMTNTELLKTKMIESQISLNANGWTLTIFTDKTFTFEPIDLDDVPKFMAALRESRTHLYAFHKAAFDELERLTKRDQELTRLSRMEKILGAIVNNVVEYPSLYDDVKNVLNGVIRVPEERLTRRDRVLGAIQDHLSDMPELHDEVPKVLNGTSTLVQCDIMKSFAKPL